MNRRQRKARLKYFKELESIEAQKRVEQRERIERFKAERERREITQVKWSRRLRERLAKAMNTPKTATGEW